MSKRYCTFITVLFCAFIGLFAVLHWALPDRESSENENRSLQQLPAPDVLGSGDIFDALSGRSGNFFSGEFMKKFETYFTDQFPARDAFISIKAAAEIALGKVENNDVYYGAGGTLYAEVPAPKEGEVDARVGYVDSLTEHMAQAGVPVYFALVPNKLNVPGERGRLLDPPMVALFNGGAPLALSVNYLGEDLWARAAQTKAHWVDLMPVFQAHAQEELFYRTDHHWTSLGAYYAYRSLMEAMGQTPVPLDRLTRTTVSEEFLGTTWSSAGAGWIGPDRIDAYVPEDGVTVTVYRDGVTGEPGSLYHPEQLEVKDKYAYFMGGNQPLYVAEKDNGGPRVLVIRDSYSDSLTPFLTLNCSQVHLFDPRYNRSSIPAYAAEHDIDAVVVLYSMSNFITDNNLFLLGIK